MLRLTSRMKLADMDINSGKKTRLYRLLYKYGPANGTLMLLPIDQGLEHGPVDFFANPESVDPEYQFRLALEGGFSGIALHIGLAEKYYHTYAGRVPLVLKLNGKTNVPSDSRAFSSQLADVADAVRLGADAVGYTLYVGSPSQDRDFVQLMSIRQDAERFGMPLIIWSYPRGQAIEDKGGRNSLYAIDYASRVAAEAGADVIKLNFPKPAAGAKNSPPPYDKLDLDLSAAVAKLVRSAGKSIVIFAGGGKISDEDLLGKVRLAMAAGAGGLIFGRNVWQRPYKQALAVSERIHKILNEFSG